MAASASSRRRPGRPVTIALADIVSGKPVPPRPSARHRVSAHDAELHVLALWPEVETRPLGGWLLRAAPPYEGRLRRRANSVLAMGEPEVPLPEALAAIDAFYADRDRPALAQVEPGSDEEAGLVAAGWTPLPDGEADFMIGSVAQVLRHTGPAGTEAVLDQSGDRVDVRIGDAARGRAALDGDWVGIHTVEVSPDHRRRGLATHVIAELLDWGASQGATTAWLHVEKDNPAAIALYERLGMAVHHSCRYLGRRGA